MNLLAQSSPIHVLHRDKIQTIVLADFVDMGNVRMVEGRGGLGLLHETKHALATGCQLSWQDFQRNVAIKLKVLRQVDFTHPALAQLGQNLVAAKLCACGETHRVKPSAPVRHKCSGTLIFTSSLGLLEEKPLSVTTESCAPRSASPYFSAVFSSSLLSFFG